MTDRNQIGSTIRTLREKAGMTQSELADKLGVSHQAVSQWERGDTLPDILTIPTLANLFGESVATILGVEETSPAAAKTAETVATETAASEAVHTPETEKAKDAGAQEVTVTVNVDAAEADDGMEPPHTFTQSINDWAEKIRTEAMRIAREATGRASQYADSLNTDSRPFQPKDDAIQLDIDEGSYTISIQIQKDGQEFRSIPLPLGQALARQVQIVLNGSCDSLTSAASVSVTESVNGDVTAGGSCTVEGSVEGNVHCGGSCSVDGDVGGSIECGGSVSVDADVEGDVRCGGSCSVDGDVGGSVDTSGACQIDGDISGNVTSGSSCTIEGDVEGDVEAGSWCKIEGDVEGSVSCRGTLTVDGKVVRNDEDDDEDDDED